MRFFEKVLFLSQLDGEGMRQMQLQQENPIKETFKEDLLKKASDTTGVDISDLRHSSNAETQTSRINNMLRPTNFRDVFVQQGTKPSRPSQFTEESSETFLQEPQVFDISDADTDIDEKVARAKSLADYELRQHGIRAQQMIEGVTQEAVSALLEKEQNYTQQRAQDQAQAAAEIQQIKHQAQGLINEAQGAVYILEGAMQKEQQERQRMKAEEEQAKQTRQQEQQTRRREQEIRRREKEREQNARRKIQEEENARRNAQREPPVTPDRPKPQAKSGPSPKKPSPKPSPKKLEPVPIFPAGGGKASGSTYNPESAHEPKGPSGRPSNIQPTNQGPPVKTDAETKPTAKAKAKAKGRPKANPDRDTKRINNPDPEFWRSVTVTALRDQLNKRGFRKHKKEMELT